ncbi:MAG: sugar phosphate isomerase/epimerase [Anaerolineae bacterium]|nr:sugar phosphate isomerase/epimerase [Anaerolineae bacterium]
MTTLLIAAYRQDIRDHLALAQTYNVGLEIQAFSHPQVLTGDWRALLKMYQSWLCDFPGPIAFHGAFFDISGASDDPDIVALTRKRYLLSMDIAAELGAEHIVFHTNFIPMIRTERYRLDFIQRLTAFLDPLGYEAEQRNLWIAMENMWDPDPSILKAIMQGTTAPHIGVCLDISHAYLYNNAHPLDQWVTQLIPYLIHCHLNNTRGVIDEHLALNVPGGAINFSRLLQTLARLPNTPWLVLELDDPHAVAQSLKFTRRILA